MPPRLPGRNSQKPWEPRPFLPFKQTVSRLRRYLSGRSESSLSARDVATLGPTDWSNAVREKKYQGWAAQKLIYAPPSEMEATVPDRSPTPFELFYEREIISQIEKHLTPNEWPYWEALLLGERPRHIAARLGIDRKLASKKMKKLEAKVIPIVFKLSRSA